MKPALPCVLLLWCLAASGPAQTESVAASPARADAARALPPTTCAVLRFAGLQRLHELNAQADWLKLWRDARMQEALDLLHRAWQYSLEDADPAAALVWSHAKPLISVPVLIALDGALPDESPLESGLMIVLDAGSEAAAWLGALHALAGFVPEEFQLREATERHAGHDITHYTAHVARRDFALFITEVQGMVLITTDRTRLHAMLARLADSTQPSLNTAAAWTAAQRASAESVALEFWIDTGPLVDALRHTDSRLAWTVGAWIERVRMFGAKTLLWQSRVDSGWGVSELRLNTAGARASETPASAQQQAPSASPLPDTAVAGLEAHWNPRSFADPAVRNADNALSEVDRALRQVAGFMDADGDKEILPALPTHLVAYAELSRLASVPNAVILAQGGWHDGLLVILDGLAEAFELPVHFRKADNSDVIHIDRGIEDGGAWFPGDPLRSLVRPCLAPDGDCTVFALNPRGLEAARQRLRAAPLAAPVSAPGIHVRAAVNTARLMQIAVKQKALPSWVQRDPLLKLVEDPAIAPLLPPQDLQITATQDGVTLRWNGVEPAVLLGMAAELLLDGDGVPLLALPHIGRHLKSLQDTVPQGR